MEVINLFISLFQACMTFLFTLELVPGVYIGWIFIVVVVMFMLIKYFLKGDQNG